MKAEIIDLDDYRSSKTVKGYVFPPACELLTGRDIDKLVKEGKWTGTYTPQAPYGKYSVTG